jgi:hypothetical protein
MVAAQQAIDQNLAPILTLSYGACEPDVSPSDAAATRDLAQQDRTRTFSGRRPQRKGRVQVTR